MVSEPIRLKPSERRELRLLLKRGRESARVLRRAQILLLAHKDWNRNSIKEATGASIPTINRTKRWYREDGLESAVYDAVLPGRPKKIDPEAKAILIATACTEAPDGRSRWTYELLAKHAPLKERVTEKTVRLVLQADGFKPWREKNVVRSDSRRGVPR